MKHSLRHWSEYLLARLLFFFFSFLPSSFVSPLSRVFSFFWYRLDKRRRTIARDNLLSAMPDVYNEKNVDKGVREVFYHLTCTLLEVFPLYRRGEEWLRKHTEQKGMERIKKAEEKGKGIIFFTPHLGNWEYASAIVGIFFKKVHSVYRPFDNPLLNDFLVSLRLRNNQYLIPKQNLLRKLLKVLKDNEPVGLLVDQHVNPWPDGIWVNFFHKPAATSPLIAILYHRTGAPVIPVSCYRSESGKIFFEVHEELQLQEGKDAVAENTLRVNEKMEEIIRKHPEQWLWIHRRWKTSPSEDDTVYQREKI